MPALPSEGGEYLTWEHRILAPDALCWAEKPWFPVTSQQASLPPPESLIHAVCAAVMALCLPLPTGTVWSSWGAKFWSQVAWAQIPMLCQPVIMSPAANSG